ncbi:hypothetical protein, partial [Neisseria meningitidis]|uniref:hypothetical protein n=1 Tax=Neisseria meningitidis TaxID=487 RepID=UPI001C88C22C
MGNFAKVSGFFIFAIFELDNKLKRPSENFQTDLDSDFKCNTSVLVVGTDSRIKHLAFRSQVFFLVGGSTHLEPC